MCWIFLSTKPEETRVCEEFDVGDVKDDASRESGLSSTMLSLTNSADELSTRTDAEAEEFPEEPLGVF